MSEVLKLKVGEIWYVKLNGVTTLKTVIIKDITPLTVAVENATTEFKTRPNSIYRYEKSNVKFIELAPENEDE